MKTQVTICDDSKLARKMMTGSLPKAWDVELAYAENGEEALKNIEQGIADVLFLDLNMPVLDGYGVMEAIRNRDLKTMVIVVSGDIQDKAKEIILGLGALDFIEKPINKSKLVDILLKYGLLTEEEYNRTESPEDLSQQKNEALDASTDDKLDAVQELLNISMGQAGRSLSILTNEFINLPIPKVNLLHPNEIEMALIASVKSEKLSAVSKGFTGKGVRGEAVIVFAEHHISALSQLLGYPKSDDNAALETLMDISNVIVGTCLNALSSSLGIRFTNNTPSILGVNCDVNTMMRTHKSSDSKILMVEIEYGIAKKALSFELLLWFPDFALDQIYKMLTVSKTSQVESEHA